MKRFYLFIVICLLVQVASAQQLIVNSLKLVSQNASATEVVEKDINDVPCAVLKVKTSEKGLKIGGNVVGSVITNGQEYIANIANGTKKITVVGKGLYPLTVLFGDHDISVLKSNCCYEMVLTKTVCNNEVSGSIRGHDYVDLGLSVKWATKNIGAENIKDCGDYYRFGESRPARDMIGQEYSFIKMFYNDNDYERTIFFRKHDTAKKVWGGSWRLPTSAEFEELQQKCKKTWTFRDGVRGIMFTGPNGNRIFLPIVDADYLDDGKVYCWHSGVQWYEDTFVESQGIGGMARDPDLALPIRPVSDEPRKREIWQDDYSMKPDSYYSGYGCVDLGLSVKWATMNVGAKSLYDVGNYFRWGETTPWGPDSGKYKWGTVITDSWDWYHQDYDKKYGPEGRSVLEDKDDAASVHWSKSWRTPTVKEIEELKEKCDWIWTYNFMNKGASGYIVISKVPGFTDKSIFLPVDIENKTGEYMTNTRKKSQDSDNNWDTSACYYIKFAQFNIPEIDYASRTLGWLLVRPVR